MDPSSDKDQDTNMQACQSDQMEKRKEKSNTANTIGESVSLKPLGNYKVKPIPPYSGKPKITKTIIGTYECLRENGTGSFGVVYKAKNIKTDEIVAVKRVLQDRRYKNRELQIMKMMNHPNIVRLIDSYLDTAKEGVYLSLILEYMPLNLNQYCHTLTSGPSMLLIKLYMYQLLRSLSYIHRQGICHRDIKPQNLLVHDITHSLKLCDFGSAKVLVEGEPNVAYICSRYYRAPELIFESSEYTSAIDIWSAGCVMAELILGEPLFAGETQASQLLKIVKILGTPTIEEVFAMNPNYKLTKMSQVLPHPWKYIFPPETPPEAIELLTKILVYNPKTRIDPLEACIHPFFDELRASDTVLPNRKQLPSLFNFLPDEIDYARRINIIELLIPPHIAMSY